MIGEPL